jgi:dolichol-phosphate mannosyltransferase
VGGSGVVVDMGVIWLLSSPEMLGWYLSLSKVIAAEVALINNFAGNEVWTFRELAAAQAACGQRLIRLLKFNLICAAGIVLSVLLLNLQVHALRVNVYLANFLSIVAVRLWNFFLNLKFGWKNEEFQSVSLDVPQGDGRQFPHPRPIVGRRAEGGISPAEEGVQDKEPLDSRSAKLAKPQ